MSSIVSFVQGIAPSFFGICSENFDCIEQKILRDNQRPSYLFIHNPLDSPVLLSIKMRVIEGVLYLFSLPSVSIKSSYALIPFLPVLKMSYIDLSPKQRKLLQIALTCSNLYLRSKAFHERCSSDFFFCSGAILGSLDELQFVLKDL